MAGGRIAGVPFVCWGNGGMHSIHLLFHDEDHYDKEVAIHLLKGTVDAGVILKPLPAGTADLDHSPTSLHRHPAPLSGNPA